jgi:SAM-dependent methyltransferase
MTLPTCRHCSEPLSRKFLNLGFQPPSNAYLSEKDLSRPEVTFPLRLNVCETCWLVQTEDFTSADEVFTSDYAYFSSTSKGWLAHAKDYSVSMIERFNLGQNSQVIEVASNDGYLLKNFVLANIPCLGIEPTESTAAAAEEIGVPTLKRFFGEELAQELIRQGKTADLVIGNNVYAHVPDINDFTKGLERVLATEGVVTLEFPHLMRLVEFCQFDTVYHEHFSYLSLVTVTRIFESAGLRIFDVEELPTHGGSLRIFGCRKDAHHAKTPSVTAMLAEERLRCMEETVFYEGFQSRAENVKNALLSFLLDAKKKGARVAAYGAAAKGNTILNFAGVRADLLPFVCDAAAAKQGKFMPGSHLPILAPEAILKFQPDFIVILPWNIAAEVREQLFELARRGTRFVTAVPNLEIS